MKKIIIDEKRINDVLNVGVAEIIKRDHLFSAIKSGKELRIKFGIDPTKPDLHLGHSVPLRKLRQFQDLGHKAVLIIGDFTAMIGDPSGRSETRQSLSKEEVKKNMKNYLKHAAKILNIKKTEIHYNSKWLNKGLSKILEIAKSGTIQQILHRSDFKSRLENAQDISILETIYPLLQGYDSVEVKADVEIGGEDQKFNLLMGRQVQRFYNIPEQDILTVPLIEGLDGTRKMSKSFNNYISLDEKPIEMFNKIMSLPDNLITKYMELCAEIPIVEIKKVKDGLSKQTLNPRDIKMKLAYEIVKLYHDKTCADKARENFITTFQKKEIPKEMWEIKCATNELLKNIFLKNKILSSKSEWHRLIKERAIHDISNSKNIDKNIDDLNFRITGDLILKIGKKRFFKISIKN